MFLDFKTKDTLAFYRRTDIMKSDY